MATGKAEKSGFLQEYLVKHPDTAKEAIDAAWQKAGHEGTISTSLISKVRRDLAQSVKGAPKKSWPREAKEERPAAEAKASRNPVTASPAAPEASVSARAGALMRLEGSLDDMLHEVKLVGGLPEFEAALRRARRILIRSHEG